MWKIKPTQPILYSVTGYQFQLLKKIMIHDGINEYADCEFQVMQQGFSIMV